MVSEFTDESGNKHFVLHAETVYFGLVPTDLPEETSPALQPTPSEGV